MDAPRRPALPLHMAVLKNDGRSLARWKALSKEEGPQEGLRGRKPWAWDVNGDTALHHAARSGDVATVKELLSLKLSAYVRNVDHETPLAIAARAGHFGVVEVLMGKQPSKRTVLMALTNASTREIIDLALEFYSASRDEILNLALCIAVEDNIPVTVDLLLKSGASPNSINAFGTPVLTLSSVTGYEMVTKILLQAGANVHIKSRQDESVVHAVARAGKSSMLSLLVKLGVDVNHPDQYNRTPLFYAVENRNNDIIDFLLRENANINHADKRLWTPLHLAAKLGKSPVVMKLLFRGATPNALNEDGMKPWEIARSKRLRILLRRACAVKPEKSNQ